MNEKILNALAKKGYNLSIYHFHQYSKVSLKRSRMKKKFNKNPSRYLSKKGLEMWFGYNAGKCIFNIFGVFSRLDIKPINEPIGKLYYTDKK